MFAEQTNWTIKAALRKWQRKCQRRREKPICIYSTQCPGKGQKQRGIEVGDTWECLHNDKLDMVFVCDAACSSLQEVQAITSAWVLMQLMLLQATGKRQTAKY